MLSDALKKQIRAAHKQVSQALPGYKPRPGQTQLIAEIAKTLAGEYHRQERILVAEAGTGVGKSLAYLLSALPLAKGHGRKLVVATATVALQEQLVEKDLPLLAKESGIDFSFRLLKGRQRYCCREKLALQAAGQGELFAASQAELSLFKKLRSALEKNSWNGDRDHWPQPIEDATWARIASDKLSCSAASSLHQHCPYHQSRRDLERTDIWVVNHHLLLSDLALGGGSLLPEPEDCLYVIDEAHHLPETARRFAAVEARLLASRDWLTRIPGWLDEVMGQLKRDSLVGPAMSAQDLCQELAGAHQDVYRWLGKQPWLTEAGYRFPEGELPDWLAALAEDQSGAAGRLVTQLNKVLAPLAEQATGDAVLTRLQSQLAEGLDRVEVLQKLWQGLNHKAEGRQAPWAKWVAVHKDDLSLCVSPISVSEQLRHQLWNRCAGAVLVSATLRTHQGFKHFAMEAGLTPIKGCRYLDVPAPFDYPNQATLVVAGIDAEPQQAEFTERLAALLPSYIKEDEGTLVLFASYWQMQAVLEKCGHKLPHPPLVQGRENRQAMLEAHRLRREQGQGSILFGTGSFSEGLDLKGELLTKLLITKLPFAVPDSPVDQAHAEFIEKRGGNPFMEIALPQTARRLVQATGRLLRSESDYGTIVLFDRRVISRRYGRQLLDALPPFTREVETP
ncbi:ATP-dependent DNA helicase DinG [Gallaecimonas sp. GXIMD4217]|uniref:ATP-dependent DNA helicase DinG n=1 Tax=Gallaecimonas sp. GXIMD4217 TaxID=3131927 RepID=UPI00311AE41B